MKQKQLQFCNSNRLNSLVQLTGCLFILLFFAGSLTAQVSTLKLSTTNSSSYFDVTDNSNNSLLRMRGDGRLGINQNTPTAGLHLVSNDGLLVQGTWGSGNMWDLGAGTRMHWYSKWGAFRVGSVDGTQWDEANVGVYSFASGNNTTASGQSSTAMGNNTTVSGFSSTAIGDNITVGGNYSTAIGHNIIVNSAGSFAMGTYVSTSSIPGCFVMGDNSSTTYIIPSNSNQMTMRFNGGYRLYSNSALTTGVYMNSWVSGWTNMSDRNKKENFRLIDGELLLEKISAMPITEWNYKETDESIRYIGPMAQDFYAAFHLGGTDSLGINSIAIDGVNMAAIQSLIKRTDDLQIAQQRIEELENELTSQKKMIEQLLTEFKSVKNAVSELRKDRSNYSLKTTLLNKDEN